MAITPFTVTDFSTNRKAICNFLLGMLKSFFLKNRLSFA